MCLHSRAGQWGHTRDDAGRQHGESSLFQMEEEQKPAAAGGRTHRVVWIHQELPQSPSPEDMWVLLKLHFMIRGSSKETCVCVCVCMCVCGLAGLSSGGRI